MNRGKVLAAIVVSAALTAASVACSGSPQPHPQTEQTATIAGLPVTDGPTGPRGGVPDAVRTVENAANDVVDKLAVNAVADIEEFWRDTYPPVFHGPFVAVGRLVSWDSGQNSPADLVQCGPVLHLYNAQYCSRDHSVGWDRGGLLPDLIKAYGTLAPLVVLAHEYGHAIQFVSKIVNSTTPTIVREQQADCFAGVFLRHVAEGKSAHFTLNTSSGLDNALATIEATRDPVFSSNMSVKTETGEHGSAFDRVSAFQMGFSGDPDACTKITEQEIRERRSGLPQFSQSEYATGDIAVTEDSVNLNIESMKNFFKVPSAPKIEYSAAVAACADVKPTAPVSYCPSTNTMTIDISGLSDRATANKKKVGRLSGPAVGDFNAFILVASRFALAAINSAGTPLTGRNVALRSVCYAGAWTRDLAVATGPIVLSPGDLDKAINGLLTDGLVASDVNGVTVVGGFIRVEAMRLGVISGRADCDQRYA